MTNDLQSKPDRMFGLMLALAVDFGTRAKNAYASMEALIAADGPDSTLAPDIGELEAASKTWAAAAGMLHAATGTQPSDTDRSEALIRLPLVDLVGILADRERLTKRVVELDSERAGHPSGPIEPTTNEQDTPSIYIAGGSSERMEVGRVWIDRAIAEGARVTYDWTRAAGYDTPPTESELLTQAMTDVGAVMNAGIFWLLAPQGYSEGASTELGIAIAKAIAARVNGLARVRVIVSGRYATRNLFALLADEIYETHEQAWHAIRGRVTRTSK